MGGFSRRTPIIRGSTCLRASDDRAKLQASFVAFTRVCPASIAPYHYIDQIPDHEHAARSAARLRFERVKDRNDVLATSFNIHENALPRSSTPKIIWVTGIKWIEEMLGRSAL